MPSSVTYQSILDKIADVQTAFATYQNYQSDSSLRKSLSLHYSTTALSSGDQIQGTLSELAKAIQALKNNSYTLTYQYCSDRSFPVSPVISGNKLYHSIMSELDTLKSDYTTGRLACNGCSNICHGGCSNSCSDGCTGQCKNGCSECTGCTHDCSGGCSGCGSWCWSGCLTTCGSTCKNACISKCGSCGGCYGSCEHGCDSGCVNSCNTTCATACNVNCYSSCTNANTTKATTTYSWHV